MPAAAQRVHPLCNRISKHEILPHHHSLQNKPFKKRLFLPPCLCKGVSNKNSQQLKEFLQEPAQKPPLLLRTFLLLQNLPLHANVSCPMLIFLAQGSPGCMQSNPHIPAQPRKTQSVSR